jgi:nucleobase:cation symporter-1, NCS1 family
VMGGLITAVIGIMIMPWKLYSDAAAYIFTWLIGYSSLMGALAGILIADYWVIRRQQLSVPDLFRVRGRYTYNNGINPRALFALVLAVLPVLPGFVRAASVAGGIVGDKNFFDMLYTYAWFVTFGLGFAIYYILMRAIPRDTNTSHGADATHG